MKNEKAILILDYESIILLSCRKILERHGYKVYGAIRFSEAMDCYYKNYSEIGTIFINTNISKVDKSFNVSAFLDIDPAIKIIAMSSGLTNKLSDNFHKILPKPFTEEELLLCLE